VFGEILQSRKFSLGLAAFLIGTAALWVVTEKPFARRPGASVSRPVVALSPAVSTHDPGAAEENGEKKRREERQALESEALRRIDRVLELIDGVVGRE